MTLEEWGNLDEDVEGELVDGVLEEEEMATFLHEVVVAWLIRILDAWAERRGGYASASDTKIAIGPRRGRKPDVTLYLGGETPAGAESVLRIPPHLVVEVVSPRPRDARRDRVEKIHDYAGAGIRYYWILDPQLRILEVFELRKESGYRVALSRSSGSVRVPGCKGLVLPLDALWERIDRLEGKHGRAPKKRK